MIPSIADQLLYMGLGAGIMQLIHEYYAFKPDHGRVFGAIQMVLFWTYLLVKT
jgi:hypothetical protein